PDAEWGQRVAAAVVLRPGRTLDLEALRAWTKERIAAYKAPTRLRIVDDLPRNALGKVTKPEVARLWSD
ncbi:MAG: long-chain fatty acid--CoA ligase, partial [Thermoanaerobaculia bacterium]|nr:long-chain fatty acid--CoA ligase [Thermoanaerobaculia bacterium]